MELLGMVATVLVLVAIAVLWNTLLIVPAREEVLKERFGKFADVLQAGFHLLLPFVDRVAYRLERREQVIDIPPQSCITKDNIQVEVDGEAVVLTLPAAMARDGDTAVVRVGEANIKRLWNC